MRDPLGAFLPGEPVTLPGAVEGPLAGLRFAAKDIFDVAGHITGCGNPDWARTHGPADRTAWAVEALLRAGASLAGKTVTDELAYSLNGKNLHYGTPTNVNAPGRIPGGSSSGSAAAVAGAAVDFALGSDTGGSVRVPASYCGLFGFRPTHGRISLEGVMPLAPSFDTVGCFARDPLLLHEVAAVLLKERGQSAPEPTRLLLAKDAFALAEPDATETLWPAAEAMASWFGGAELVSLAQEEDGFEAWMECFRVIQGWEIWQVHGPWIKATEPRFAPDIGERFAWTRTITREAAEAAMALRERLRARMIALLPAMGLLCLPSAPDVAPRLDADAETLAAHRWRVLSLTSIAGLAGLPQVSLPLVRLQGLPLGLSLIGPPGGDAMLLRFAQRYALSDD